MRILFAPLRPEGPGRLPDDLRDPPAQGRVVLVGVRVDALHPDVGAQVHRVPTAPVGAAQRDLQVRPFVAEQDPG